MEMSRLHTNLRFRGGSLDGSSQTTTVTKLQSGQRKQRVARHNAPYPRAFSLYSKYASEEVPVQSA